MDRKVYPRSIGLPPTMFERALDFRELVFLREDSSVIFQTRHGINPHLRIIYYCSSALSIFWLISSMSRALRAGKGRFIPRSETIGSSIPSIVTMKLPFPGCHCLCMRMYACVSHAEQTKNTPNNGITKQTINQTRKCVEQEIIVSGKERNMRA
jgi:hypothetical protein